jgi:NTP pyrophosphatase (non-canonical NTP hydrolase)
MTPQEYRKFVAQKNGAGAHYGREAHALTTNSGLLGEAIEVLSIPLSPYPLAYQNNLKNELGDVIFYTFATGINFGLDVQWGEVKPVRNMELKETIEALVIQCGKVGEEVKKVIGHDHPLEPHGLTETLNGIIYWTIVVCQLADIKFTDVIDNNVAKLSARYPGEFTPERSRSRDQ